MNSLNKNNEFVDVIAASWARCRGYGLSHSSQPVLNPVSSSELELLREQNRELLETTEREVLPYYENILANSKCLILLTDHNGAILNNWGDQRFVESARKPLFQGGTTWLEQTHGTNAIGTAIACGHAVQVQRNEHYLRSNRFMIGSAAPILDERQTLVGVLNVSSDAYLPQAHTLGMVRLMSQSVENRLLIRRYGAGHFLLTFNTNADNLDSQWSGILAFNDSNRVVAANRRARQMLDLDPEGQAPGELFDLGQQDLRQQTDLTQLPLRSLAGRQFHGQVKRPTRPAPVAAVASDTEADTGPESGFRFSDLEFGEPRIQRCIQQASRVVDRDIPILIHGETGVGKEVFVKALHRASERRQRPMVAVNCAAIPAELVESELFGYEKGAFTGASSRGAIGLVRKAHQGMLFLDEIGEMPLSAQARLLRVLQEREVMPLGSSESYPVDIRLVSATNQSLRSKVESGQFRRDLYYRVSGLNLELPPLRERTDRRELCRRLYERYREPHHHQSLPDDILDLFERHRWPGNIRQLINVLQVALAMADSDTIAMWHLPDDFIQDLQDIQSEQQPVLAERPTLVAGTDLDITAGDDTDTLLTVYKHYKGNVSRTARHLGYSRNTVYKRLREIGVR
ncbi:MAG: sigma-54-dependent Fis family transcriptional regulator [Marinobacter sp.]|uniref:sigma-54-dependent Fis family transcriptional regulator n=1 Tax=Marinobacter sp. TaxID=50741 RepID=UPI00299E4565|nr:sigma-54-dependent Fis family transcriptional regulator [Marinobacter sp.]MDX1634625.1 sigma-54-dependent Fis family transcriptional regulator [Marinobacter sp.]